MNLLENKISIKQSLESEIVIIKGVKYFVREVRFPEDNGQGYHWNNVVCQEFQKPEKEVVFSLQYFSDNFILSDI